MTSTKIFVLSGLGADERMFQKIHLKNSELVHIKWIPPQKNEEMSAYAKRLSTQVTEPNPILLGLSLGGMLAVEMGKYLNASQIISLSSISMSSELPWYYKFGGKLKLNKIVPVRVLCRLYGIMNWFFGAKESETKQLLRLILKEMDRDFLKWALQAVLVWKNDEVPHNLKRIHGAKDRILPLNKKINYDHVFQQGHHLMVLEQAGPVSQAIEEVLND